MNIPNIFEPTGHHRFIACVGSNGHTDGQTYASGFFEAARSQLRQIFANEGNGKEMDTLVYPILYSIRHGLELGIKHLLRKISVLASVNFDLKEIEHHNLEDLWKVWSDNAPFDRRLHAEWETINKIVAQFHLADSSGQVFRYHLDTNDKKTLEDKQHVDLVSVNTIAEYVQGKFSMLFCLLDDIVKERQLGTFTSKFNRDELEQLSIELPDYATWIDSEDFLFTKKKWKVQLNIGSNKFSEAINFIKKHPEFSGNIGIESNLRFLANSDLIDIVNLHIEYLIWRGPQKEGFTKVSDYELPEGPMPDYEALAKNLSANAIGEFLALADIGRQDGYSENFEIDRLHLTPSELDEVKVREFRHFLFKLNLLPSLASGLQKVGARSLSQMVLDAKNKYESSIEAEQN